MTDLLQQLDKDERDKARETSMPDWMDPMLAKLSHEYFSSKDWIYERKLDGERIIAYVRPDRSVSLMSRNQKSANDSYPELVDALKSQTSVACILDGEVVAFDSDDVTDFQKLQGRIHVSDPQEARESDVKIFYYIFDTPYVDNYDVSKCALRSRKMLLRNVVDWEGVLRWTPYRNESGEQYYHEACRKGWEGVIAKEADSHYVHSRSNSWLKFKCINEQELVIGGFTDPHGARLGFGALLLGFYRNDELVYAGKVGTGFDNETLKELRNRLDGLERKTSPFEVGEPQSKGVHFVTPKLVCQIGFAEWTRDEKLRQPRYLGLRRDKAAEDVHKEV